MLIRKATSLDLPAIAALHISIASELRRFAPDGFGASLDNMPGAGDVAGKFRDMLDDSDNFLFVAEVDGRVAGLADGWQENHDDDLFETPFMTIEYVEVHPDFRGRGIAKLLIQALEAEAVKRGIRQIDLRVLDGNVPARELYAGFGYQPLEIRLGKVLHTIQN